MLNENNLSNPQACPAPAVITRTEPGLSHFSLDRAELPRLRNVLARMSIRQFTHAGLVRGDLDYCRQVNQVADNFRKKRLPYAKCFPVFCRCYPKDHSGYSIALATSPEAFGGLNVLEIQPLPVALSKETITQKWVATSSKVFHNFICLQARVLKESHHPLRAWKKLNDIRRAYFRRYPYHFLSAKRLAHLVKIEQAYQSKFNRKSSLQQPPPGAVQMVLIPGFSRPAGSWVSDEDDNRIRIGATGRPPQVGRSDSPRLPDIQQKAMGRPAKGGVRAVLPDLRTHSGKAMGRPAKGGVGALIPDLRTHSGKATGCPAKGGVGALIRVLQ